MLMRGLILVACATVCLLTQACVGAFVVGAAAGGAAVKEKRDWHELKEDQLIRYRLRNQLHQYPAFKEAHISLMSFKGRVLLVGQVPDVHLKHQASHIARQIPGVRQVYNQMDIGRVIQPVIRTYDAWITTKVKSLILAEKGLPVSAIRVMTEDGVVFLMGSVKSDQASIAAEIARQVAGVRKVVKVFEIV